MSPYLLLSILPDGLSNDVDPVTTSALPQMNKGTTTYCLLRPAELTRLSIGPPSGSGFINTQLGNVELDDGFVQDVVLVFTDTEMPRLVSTPVVTSITDTTALVSWLTDEPTTSTVFVDGVEYSEPGYKTEHNIQVSGLQPSARYSAEVASTDRSGNGPVTARSDEFQTMGAPDTTAPETINGPTVSSISSNSAVVRWSSSEPATGAVYFGESEESAEMISTDNENIEHEITLIGLSPLTSYIVYTELTDSAGNGPTRSNSIPFETAALPDRKPPVITSGPLVTDTTDTAAYDCLAHR